MEGKTHELVLGEQYENDPGVIIISRPVFAGLIHLPAYTNQNCEQRQ